MTPRDGSEGIINKKRRRSNNGRDALAWLFPLDRSRKTPIVEKQQSLLAIVFRMKLSGECYNEPVVEVVIMHGGY